jgi:hypothetical protein
VSDQTKKSESSPARASARSAFAVPPQVRKTSSSAKAVGSFVPRLTRKAMEKYGFSTAALLTDWAQIVGADLARYTRPHKLKWPRAVETYGETPAEQTGRPGATLHLQVEAARALDVQYKGRQIIERINAYFGYRAVADMRIEQMPIAAENPVLPRDVVAGRTSRPRASLDLSQVADDRLRAALERVQKGIAKR